MKPRNDFQIFGIFGFPLAHTLSPVMQEAAFQKCGMKAYYLPFELEPRVFRGTLKQLSHLPLNGFNITVPFKELILNYLDEISPEAKAIGAVNTVYRKGNRWVGTNTDVYGFVTALKRDAGFSSKGKKALILGAGGSSRAVCFGLCREKIAELTIVNRRLERARKLTGDLKRHFLGVRLKAYSLNSVDWNAEISKSDLVVNTTSVGLKPQDRSLVPRKAIQSARGPKKLFVDLIYRPAKTEFLRTSRQLGHRTLNGLSMLLYQGAQSFEHWTGKPAPIQTMQAALEAALAGKGKP